MKFKVVMSIVYAILLACFIGLPLSFLAFGSDLQTQQNPLYPFQSTIYLQDEFLTGNGSGAFGSLGWSTVGATIQGSETNRPGIMRLDTTAVAATQARMSFSNSGALDYTIGNIQFWVARVNTNDANTLVRIGAGNSVALSPPGNGVYFEKLDADTNWFCVTRAAAVQTRTDSTVAVNTSFNTFRIARNSSGVTFSINGTSVCGTHTTNIPSTTFISPLVFIINSAAAAKTIDVDYFQHSQSGIIR